MRWVTYSLRFRISTQFALQAVGEPLSLDCVSRKTSMGQVRALVTLRLVSDLESAAALMKRVAAYTKEHFGGRLRFEPFINESSGKIIWLNSAVNEDALAEWEQAMRDSGIRDEVIGPTFEPIRVELFDPISDPRLENLRASSTQLRSLLD